jgi:hypothetical protein
MGAIEEIKERIEHAAHEHHGGGHDPAKRAVGKPIGVTMAILGVMLAVCAALLGAERTELIRTMVEQSNKFGGYQAETTKYRVVQADYELLRALSPKPEEIRKVEETLRNKRKPSGKDDAEDTAELKDLIASSTEDMANLLTPDAADKERFQKLALRYKHDMAEAKEDAEAFDLKIKAHEEGAEGYEHAQLAAEIGIVVASVALLLSSRAAWLVSIVLALACAGLGGRTFAHTRADLEVAERKITNAAIQAAAIEKDEETDDATGASKGKHEAPVTTAAPPGAPKGERTKDAPPKHDHP